MFTPGTVAFSDFQHMPWIHEEWGVMADSHTFVVYDHPGGGTSRQALADYSLYGLESEIAAVADAADLEEFVLFTCAGDSPSAIKYAADNASRISALIIANGWARARDRVRRDEAMEYFRAIQNDWDMLAEATIRLMATGMGSRGQRTASAVRRATTPEAFIAFQDAVADHDASSFLEQVVAPTLLLHSPSNVYVPISVPEAMLRRMPNAQLVCIEFEGTMKPLVEATQRFLSNRDGLATSATTGRAELTDRQCDVLRHLVAGATNAEIAAALTLSQRTVARHLSDIYGKIGVHNRLAAANWAREHGVG